jgi:NTE family protein
LPVCGGSQTAFTAGVLKGLIDEVVGRKFNVVGLSGTSGGAVCAALVWYGFLKDDQPRWRRLIDFWKDLTAQDWAENAFNHAIIEGLRMVNSGLLPAFQLSPSSPFVQWSMSCMTAGLRKTFADFPTVLRKHIDFDEIAAWGPRREPPVLIVGAANVSTGKLAKFVSRREPIRLEHILASAAVPTIFPAVPIGGHGYWDGLFSDNPPVEELMRARSVGPENVPEEIWVIKIKPTTYNSIPERPEIIFDRRNQMEGNISLFQQLDHLELINDLILCDTFRPVFLARFHIKAPIRIPKAFSSDPDRPYYIPWIEMPAEVQ